MTSGGGRTYTWTAFEQPSKITQAGAADTTFLYDDAHSRVKETAGGTVTLTINPRLDLGHGFQRVIAPTQTTDTIYVSAMGRPVASIVTTAGAAGTSRSARWLHADALGSVVAVTDADGEAVARYAYDAWGLRLGWAASGAGERRGYTGHETLEGMGLINMNGRLYDPALARFVSADPFVPNPADWQSYNRYSYVLNNPFGYTDPSGYFHLGTFLKQVASIAAVVWAPQLSQFVWGGSLGSALGVTAGNAIVQGATAGFVAGGIQGGTLKSALIGAASGAAFGQIHGMEGLHIAERAALHGLVGGTMAELGGGDFGSGFLSTAFTTWASDAVGLTPEGGANKVTATVVRAIIGGVAARIAGGKFANGAMSAAMAAALNDFAAEMSVDGAHVSPRPEGGDRPAALSLVPGFDLWTCITGGGCSGVDFTLGVLGVVPGGGSANIAFKTGHYASRLADVGLDVGRVEALVAKEISAIPASSLTVRSDFGGRLVVDGKPVIWRAQPLSNGRISVGSIHPDDLRWKKP